MWCNHLTVAKGQTSDSGELYINLSWNLVPLSMKGTTCTDKSHLQWDFSWHVFGKERIVLLLYGGLWRLPGQGAWRSFWILREMKMISSHSSRYVPLHARGMLRNQNSNVETDDFPAHSLSFVCTTVCSHAHSPRFLIVVYVRSKRNPRYLQG